MKQLFLLISFLMAVKGLQNYGYHTLANEITNRWLSLNEQVFRKTGKMCGNLHQVIP